MIHRIKDLFIWICVSHFWRLLHLKKGILDIFFPRTFHQLVRHHWLLFAATFTILFKLSRLKRQFTLRRIAVNWSTSTSCSRYFVISTDRFLLMNFYTLVKLRFWPILSQTFAHNVWNTWPLLALERYLRLSYAHFTAQISTFSLLNAPKEFNWTSR